jgi:hypothetical protein
MALNRASGAYLRDRDMFLFLVDGNQVSTITDRSHRRSAVHLRNSDVGAAALTLDLFVSRRAQPLIWAFTVAGFRRRHVGASIHEAWTESPIRPGRPTQTSTIAPRS